MNTHDHHDDDALPGEDELKALYRTLPRKEPSPALDQAVRRTASQAVHVPTRRRMSHWPITAASAAVLVLVAGVSWHLMQLPAGVAPTPTPTMQSPATLAPAPVPNDTAAATNAPTVSAEVPPMAPAREAVATAPPAHAPMHATAKTRTNANAPMLAAKPTAQLAAPAAAPESSAADERAAYAPSPPPAAPSPMMASPAVVAGLPGVKPQAAAVERSTMAMKAMAAPAPMPAPVQMAAPPDPTALNPADTPTQELDKIRQLFALQRRDEALQRLGAFRQSHPDVPLPDDLRAQMPDHE